MPYKALDAYATGEAHATLAYLADASPFCHDDASARPVVTLVKRVVGVVGGNEADAMADTVLTWCIAPHQAWHPGDLDDRESVAKLHTHSVGFRQAQILQKARLAGSYVYVIDDVLLPCYDDGEGGGRGVGGTAACTAACTHVACLQLPL